MAEGGVTDFSEQDQRQELSNMETEAKQEKILEEPAGKAEGQDEGLSEFLERTKCDRMYELRQIQYGERPVTSTGRKNVIDSFFAKHMQAQEAKLESGKENVPVNVENVDEIRPETVVVEIQGLVEQQRVSNVLGTAFRRRLENIIRGTISNVSNVSRGPRASPQPSTSHSTTPQPSPYSTNNTTPHSLSRDGTPSVAATPNSLSREGTPMEAEIQNVPRAVEQLQHEERSRSNSITSARSGLSAHSTASSSGSSTHNNENRSLPQPTVNNSQENNVNLGNIPEHVMEEMQQEQFIQEISELVHRQLVTSTLQGNFRTTLELTMRDHMRSTDSDGQRVQEFVQSLQPTQPVIRNDFSHLGIPLNNQDNLDNISVTSVSAHAVPYTQSNMYLSREMASLKAQVEEMKNMLKVSFDLQLDIQRAIRQEVAAAMSEKSDGTRETATSRQSRPVNDSHCLICLDKFSDSVLYQCGHMCVCYGCGRQLMSRGSKCPVCRAPIKDIIRAYRCNYE